MRYIFLLPIIFVFTILKAHTQVPIQNYVVLDSIISLNRVGDFGPSSRNLILTTKDNIALCYVGDSRDSIDGLTFIRVNLITKKLDSFKVMIPSPLNNLNSFIARSIALSPKYCALLFTNNILVLEFKNELLQFNKWIPLQSPFGYIGIQNNHVLLGRCYNHHPADAKHPTELQKINIHTGEVVTSVHPEFDAIEFSHFDPSHWVDFSDKFIVFAQTLHYKIDVYDNNLNLVSCLQKNKDWKMIDTTKLNILRKRSELTAPKKIIEELRESDRGDGQRVLSTRFITDSLIIVCFTSKLVAEKKLRTFYYDIWKLRNGKWELLIENIFDTKPTGDLICKPENYMYSGVTYNQAYSNLYSASVRVAPESNVLFQMGKEYSKIYKEIDDYIAKHEPIYQVYIHKFNPDILK